MILVDSSVWIDQLAGRRTRHVIAFERLMLAEQALALGDLMLVEILQGVRDDRAAAAASVHFAEFTHVTISDHNVATTAAQLYRSLRGRGITIRKTIDTLIATRCIVDSMPLLYADRDFDPFVRYHGLVSALDIPGVH